MPQEFIGELADYDNMMQITNMVKINSMNNLSSMALGNNESKNPLVVEMRDFYKEAAEEELRIEGDADA